MPFDIAYYASDDSMGDASPEERTYFRHWAEQQLKVEYPDHRVYVASTKYVSSAKALGIIRTDDNERLEEIQDYAKRLWGRCWSSSTGDLSTGEPTDDDITDCMYDYGGSFAKQLAILWSYADITNQARIKAGWPGYWEKYRQMVLDIREQTR